jgi:hypothetical protein
VQFELIELTEERPLCATRERMDLWLQLPCDREPVWLHSAAVVAERRRLNSSQVIQWLGS